MEKHVKRTKTSLPRFLDPGALTCCAMCGLVNVPSYPCGCPPASFPEPCQSLEEKSRCYFFFFKETSPAAHGSSQARGRIGAVASGPHYNHSFARPKLHLQPMAQLTAMPSP